MGKRKRLGIAADPEAESLRRQIADLKDDRTVLTAEVRLLRKRLKAIERQWQDLIQSADRILDPAQSAVVIDSENLAVSFSRLFQEPYNFMAAALAVDYLIDRCQLADPRGWYYASASDDAFARLLDQHAYTTRSGTEIEVVKVGHRSVHYNSLDVWLVTDVYRRIFRGELPEEKIVLVSGDSDYCVLADFLVRELKRKVFVAHLGESTLSHVYGQMGIETIDLAAFLRGNLPRVLSHDKEMDRELKKVSAS